MSERPTHFKCDMCNTLHEKNWDAEDAMREEARKNFGEDFFERDDQASVCDDCYNQLKIEHPELL